MRISRILISSLLLLEACRSDTAAPRSFEVRRLADEVGAATDRTTHVERVAGVIRAALPGVYSVAMLPVTPAGLTRYPPGTRFELQVPSVRTPVVLPEESHVSFAAAEDDVDVSFLCPARLLGRPAILTVENPGPERTRAAQPFRCPTSADVLAHVHLPVRIDGENTVTYVRGLETERVEAGNIELPAGTRLRVALGLIPAITDQPLAPGHFHVLAENANGLTATVLDRRLDPSARPEDGGWVLVDVDLEPVRRAIGPNVRLVFEAAADDGGRQSTFPVWGDPTVMTPAAARVPPPPRWNLVLVSLDTLRADRLGAYGATRPTSPHLDALAAESTLFETVIVPAPWTLPSHTSMMTGLHSCAHGMVGPSPGQSFPPGLVPLAQRLRDAGYSTAAITEDGFVDATAFLRGFGYYWENGSGNDRVRRTVAEAEGWLRTEATEPFFLFLHTYQTHDPYFSPPTYAGIVASADARSAVGGATNSEGLEKYDAAVRYTDDAIAPLLAALRASPRGKRTLLVVTSDHGEAFGEHGYTGHGRSLDEEVLRVPLLVWGPGLVASGRRVPGAVGVIDIAPTVLDLLGLPMPPGITGVSLAGVMRAEGAPSPVPERVLFSENTLNGVYRLAARWPRWKAVWENASFRIVDLARDPEEPASEATPELDAKAATARRQFEEECARQRTALAAAGGGQPEANPRVLDPERERQLKALGYVD